MKFHEDFWFFYLSKLQGPQKSTIEDREKKQDILK